MLKRINKFLFQFSLNNVEIYSKFIAVLGIINFIFLFPDYLTIYSDTDLIPNNYVSNFTSDLNITFYSISNVVGNHKLVVMLCLAIYLYGLLSILFDFYGKFIFSIIILFIHLLMTNTKFVFSYGADFFINLSFFINILFQYNGKNNKILKSFGFRFLQIHLCLVYFFAGLGKSFGVDWYDGNALIKVSKLYISPHIQFETLPHMIFMILGVLIMLFQLFFFLLISNNYTRNYAFIFIIILHLFIAIGMRFYTFGLVMIVLNIIAWGNYLPIKNLQNLLTNVRVTRFKL
ncbi:hypothetical protein [Chryseobacterium bernardetii]|uniref:hypothetical protein n=1 Tax=Chryseobacterium bernardetii TaxID=1241978 RepID=UPI003AF62141